MSKIEKELQEENTEKKAMMATLEDLEEEQENAESQGEEEIVANLCFIAYIVFEEETKVTLPNPKFSYHELQKAYDELLDDFQTLSSHCASLEKSFQKLSFDLKNLESEKEKLKKDELLKENNLLKKDISALKIETFESAQKASYDVSKLQKIVKLLKSGLKKMVNGSKNLDLMLGGQRKWCHLQRIGRRF